MSLSCDCDFGGDVAWWWSSTLDFTALKTKRNRKCCSCGVKLKPNDEVVAFVRWRNPQGDIEERIYADEVPLATWYMCETCGGLAMAVQETGMCFSIGESMKQQIADFRAGVDG